MIATVKVTSREVGGEGEGPVAISRLTPLHEPEQED